MFLALSGILGGFALVIAPEGNLLQMPVSLIQRSFFSNYLIPGIILLLFLGIFPLIVSYALLRIPSWRVMESLNIYKEQYWAWSCGLYLGILLITWIDVQIYLIGYHEFIQIFYAFYGVLLVIVALHPSVRNSYKLKLNNKEQLNTKS